MVLQIIDKLPEECQNIDEVRHEIDNLDQAIIKFLAARYDYVKKIVEYKENTAESIEANERRKEVFETRRQWAEEAGISPDVVESMYKTLVEYFVEEEKRIVNS